MSDELKDKATKLIWALLGLTALDPGKSPNVEIAKLIEKEHGNHIAFTAMELMDVLWPELAHRRDKDAPATAETPTYAPPVYSCKTCNIEVNPIPGGKRRWRCPQCWAIYTPSTVRKEAGNPTT